MFNDYVCKHSTRGAIDFYYDLLCEFLMWFPFHYSMFRTFLEVNGYTIQDETLKRYVSTWGVKEGKFYVVRRMNND